MQPLGQTRGRALFLRGGPQERRWREEAACRSVDPSLFFPAGVTGPAAVQIAEAKAVCASCPVRVPCLEFALATNQEYGVWGGTSEEERRELRRAARRAQAPTGSAQVALPLGFEAACSVPPSPGGATSLPGGPTGAWAGSAPLRPAS